MIQKCILVELLSSEEWRIGSYIWPAHTRNYRDVKSRLTKRLTKYKRIINSQIGDYERVDDCFTASLSRSIRNLAYKGLIVYDELSPGGRIGRMQLTSLGAEKALNVNKSVINFKSKIKVYDCSKQKSYFVIEKRARKLHK